MGNPIHAPRDDSLAVAKRVEPFTRSTRMADSGFE